MRVKEKEMINELEKKIEQTKTMPKEINDKLNKKILDNLLIAVGIAIYSIFLICGFHNIEKAVYIKDLKIFSLFLLGLTIAIIEYSYKKQSGTIAIYAIESLVLAIITLFSTYICILQESKFLAYIALIFYLFAIYYIIKSIVIYKKTKNRYIKSLSDINEIIKKNEPEKKEKTQRKRR